MLGHDHEIIIAGALSICDVIGEVPVGLAELGVGADADDLEPDAECIGSGGPIITGGYEVTAELEVVVDPAVGGQKTLRMTGRLEAFHMPFSPAGRLM